MIFLSSISFIRRIIDNRCASLYVRKVISEFDPRTAISRVGLFRSMTLFRLAQLEFERNCRNEILKTNFNTGVLLLVSSCIIFLSSIQYSYLFDNKRIKYAKNAFSDLASCIITHEKHNRAQNRIFLIKQTTMKCQLTKYIIIARFRMKLAG